jgi:hypothetical protein
MEPSPTIAWPFTRADEILRACREITTAAPRELAVWLELLHAPAAPFVPQEWHGQRLCAMAVCYSGDLAETAQALAPIRALGAPVVDLLHEQPYTQVQYYLDATEPKGMHYYWKTDYLAELTDDFLSELAALFAECPIPEADLGVLNLGGSCAANKPDRPSSSIKPSRQRRKPREQGAIRLRRQPGPLGDGGALFRRAAAGRHEAQSAGSNPGTGVHPHVVEALAEIGLNARDHHLRELDDEAVEWADVVVATCDDACPVIPGKRYISWQLPDPKPWSTRTSWTTSDARSVTSSPTRASRAEGEGILAWGRQESPVRL